MVEEGSNIINISLENLKCELSDLKNEMSVMKCQIESLEKSNKVLVREKNFLILKEFSLKLITHIDNNEFERFTDVRDT
jgi:hypothetical protein